jgi:LPS sulfotransferase NodH
VAPDGSELERLKPHQDPVYDGAAIRRHRDEMLAMDRQWHDWFAREGIAPLRLTYDALAADPRATLARVLRALGLDERVAGGVAVGVKRLSDETSRAWVERFQAEQRGGHRRGGLWVRGDQ